ncbi:MAG: hypothetical protein ACOY3Z_01165 [Thermodesulfobacteriota bacterium]
MKGKRLTATGASGDNGRDNAPFFRDLESRASQHSVHALRLRDSSQAPLGVLLINSGANGQEVEAALARLGLGGRSFDAPAGSVAAQPESSAGQGSQARLLDRLAVELDRVQRTRMPCSLLLAKIVAAPAAAAAALAPCLHQVDILLEAGENTLAVILPGTNLGKARKRAEEFRAALRLASGAKARRQPMAFGLAVCHAYDTIAAGQLLEAAQGELAVAAQEGGDAIRHAAAMHHEDTCQVTVEERAQLFSLSLRSTTGRSKTEGKRA